LQAALQAEDLLSEPKPAVLRSLQQEALRTAKVVYVATAADLQAAVNAGSRHIEITEHLDLTILEPFLDEGDEGFTYSLTIDQ
jgi:hypothetical protein